MDIDPMNRTVHFRTNEQPKALTLRKNIKLQKKKGRTTIGEIKIAKKEKNNTETIINKNNSNSNNIGNNIEIKKDNLKSEFINDNNNLIKNNNDKLPYTRKQQQRIMDSLINKYISDKFNYISNSNAFDKENSNFTTADSARNSISPGDTSYNLKSIKNNKIY